MRMGGSGKPLKAGVSGLDRGALREGALQNAKGPERGLRSGPGRCVGSDGQRTDWAASIRAVARSFSGLIVSFMAEETTSVTLFIWAT